MVPQDQDLVCKTKLRYPVSQKHAINLLSIPLPSTDHLSEFFRWHTTQKICTVKPYALLHYLVTHISKNCTNRSTAMVN